MILRKPYAFLIKYFKLIHIIITVITLYLIYKSTGVLSFLNDYILNNTSVVGQAITDRLFHPFMYLGVIVSIVMAIVVLILMKMKEKPVVFYFFNTAVYVYILIVFLLSRNILGTMELEIVDIRIVRLLQDMYIAMIFLEFISLCLTFVRSTGFDVKKFDFVRDMKEISIEETDNEEFEVDVEVDTDRYMRKLRRKFRHMKYVYIENKFLIHIVIAVVIGFTVGSIYLLNRDQSKIINQNRYFSVNNFTMNVTNSYTTKYNYLANKVSDQYSLVVLELHVKNNYQATSKLENARMELNVDGISFHPTNKYNDVSFDLGMPYENYDITTDEDVYTVIYEIPNHLINKKMYYRYVNNTGGKSTKVKIKPMNLDQKETTELTLGKKVYLKEGILTGTSLKVSNFEINDLFKINYQFCVESKECYDSVDNIRPTLDQNYDETLMRVSLETTFNENYTNDNIVSNKDILSTFGVIKYRLKDDKQDRTLRPTIKKLSNNTNKNNVYMEVNSELKQAIQITLELQIRNQTISYKLK